MNLFLKSEARAAVRLARPFSARADNQLAASRQRRKDAVGRGRGGSATPETSFP